MDSKNFARDKFWDWIYTKGAKSFFEMTNLGTSLRELLTANF
ncbi:hypothetical protein [Candidatus Midichloria mitochondrii]